MVEHGKQAAEHLEKGVQAAAAQREQGLKQAALYRERGIKQAALYGERGRQAAAAHLERGVKQAVAVNRALRLKKLTLLHSNDMHGDFLADEVDDKLVGGVSMLSGYIEKTRLEEKNVVYAVAGDMFRGSLIDSESHGLSTIQIMNMLTPDVATIGNHEVDYGVAHMLFLEKCADFPIVSANLRIKTNNARLFDPFHIVEVGGMKILFIGVVTEAVISRCKDDGIAGSLVVAEDALKEIGRICDTYNGLDIDLTVLLTHIGFEEDKKLAAQLDPTWGIDLIIGGHSHTLLDEPCVVNGIPIAQVGVGTDYVGRFDIMVDTLFNRIDSFTWQTVPIDSEHCPEDEALKEFIFKCKKSTDAKYNQVVTRLARRLMHPVRCQETELGDLFADMLRDALGVDLFLLASGSIRGQELGPIVTKGDLAVCFPYDGTAHAVYMTGAQLKHALLHAMRDETFAGGHAEFFQVSSGLELEYDQSSHSFTRFDFDGEPVEDDQEFTVGIQQYSLTNTEYMFDMAIDELRANRHERTLASSCAGILEEVLNTGEYRDVEGIGRLTLNLC